MSAIYRHIPPFVVGLGGVRVVVASEEQGKVTIVIEGESESIIINACIHYNDIIYLLLLR